MWHLWRRELRAYFLSPAAYAAAAGFLCLSGVVFMQLLRENMRMPQQLQSLMALSMGFWLPLLAAVATMRLFAEERQTGTLETLLTAPISDAAVVAGKFLAAYVFLLLLLLCGAVPLWVLLWTARQVIGFDPGGLVGALTCLALMAGSATAVGSLMSLCTRHQAVAAFTTLLLLASPYLAHLALATVMPEWRWRVGGFPVEIHLMDFSSGLLDLRVVLLHGSVMVLCLTMCTRILESRQWRT